MKKQDREDAEQEALLLALEGKPEPVMVLFYRNEHQSRKHRTYTMDPPISVPNDRGIIRDDLLSLLQEQERKVIILRYEGYTMDEIATELAISTAGVYKIIQRVIKTIGPVAGF